MKPKYKELAFRLHKTKPDPFDTEGLVTWLDVVDELAEWYLKHSSKFDHAKFKKIAQTGGY